MILEIEDVDKQKLLYKKVIENLSHLKSLKQSFCSDDEDSAKFSMVRNVFEAFLDRFEDDMNDGREGLKAEVSIKQNLLATVDKMINVLES